MRLSYGLFQSLFVFWNLKNPRFIWLLSRGNIKISFQSCELIYFWGDSWNHTLHLKEQFVVKWYRFIIESNKNEFHQIIIIREKACPQIMVVVGISSSIFPICPFWYPLKYLIIIMLSSPVLFDYSAGTSPWVCRSWISRWSKSDPASIIFCIRKQTN